jgi:peptidoglycan/LPS O-acetylase OafA/YrhL
LVVLFATSHVNDLGALPIAYLVLWAGARLPVRWGRRTDLSYGVYVYGWPVQSVLSLAGGAVLGPVGFAGVALLSAGAIAALSWRFVESPALRLRTHSASPRAATSPGVEDVAPAAVSMTSTV